MFRRAVVCLLPLVGAAAAALAAPPAPTAPPPPEPSTTATVPAATPTTASATRSSPPEPAVQESVIEDDHVRVEELRVRGLNRRLTVQPKSPGAKAYEILPDEPGRDAADRRVTAGQRVWRVLSF
jgi:hypothetical protein